MAVNLGTILRVASQGLNLVAKMIHFVADVCDNSNVTVSWEFAVVMGILLAQRRFGLLCVIVTIALIVSWERGNHHQLTLGWMQLIADAQQPPAFSGMW